MKNILMGVLILIAMGLSFASGMYYPKPQVTKTVTALPSPTPDTDKFSSDKAVVKSFDGKKLVYTLENGTEKTVSDTKTIDVWLAAKKQGDKAVKSDWTIVKAGMKIQVASEKTTGRVVALLVL